VHVSQVWFCTALAVSAAGFGANPLPTPPAGWKLEVVAAAPVVRHPSVVCCAPDGRVFVAEDPMDISLPSADAPQGRIVCIHPGGRVTVFAEKLYAVFGMQYLDGKLYVLHNPRLTVFRDDGGGVGKDSVDLIKSTNPNPWALNWNDHVPANFKLAMDGYFYVAVGDKGLYGAVGTDGRRVDMRGGGVVRLRPDGSGLEVFCTGVRNILDVAVNDEDEIFTYDNTDEHDWMGRLTHMVDGGFYGYPYDFVPRRPYTLWMMADFGAGAATGTFAYNEDALPEEYRGNLFLADFGKRNVLRVRVEREGAAYKVVSRKDLFSDVPPDFRPVGITPSPDGAAVYICDWQHVDTKETVEVGRLLKLTYAGATHAAAKPPWYVPAATGRQFSAETAELVAALSHPAHSVRMVAQRRLAERGAEAVGPVRAVLARHDSDRRAKWHAIWTLDAVDGGQSARREIIALAGGERGADAGVVRQAMRQLGTRRVAGALPVLTRAMFSEDASVRFHAATALARVGDPGAVLELVAAFHAPTDPWARHAGSVALNRIARAHPEVWERLAAELRAPADEASQGCAFAMRETYDARLVEAVAAVARDPKARPESRATALSVLAPLHHKLPEWKGEWWAYHPALSPPPPKTVDWVGTPIVLAVLRDSLAARDEAVVLAALEGLRDAGDPAAAESIRRVGAGPRAAIRSAAVRALATCDDGRSVRFLTDLLSSPLGDESQDALVLQTLGRLKATEAVETIKGSVSVSSAKVRGAAFEALVRIGGGAASAAIKELMDHQSAAVRRDAVAAAGELGDRALIPRLLSAYAAPDTRDAAVTALAQMPDVRAAAAYIEGLAPGDFARKEKCLRALRDVRDAALPAVEAAAATAPDEVLLELRQVYQDHEKARGGPVFARRVERRHPDEYLSFALDHAGDARKGEKLFAAATAGGVGCATCHVVNGAGGTVGPDLSEIGAKYSRRDLAESVLYPNKAVREGYQQVIARTRSGQTYAGPLKTETSDLVVLQEADGTLRRISKADVEARKDSGLSPMPEGLCTGLSPEQFTDLVSYLESLKAPPEGATPKEHP
jgi:putative membrane-bound dehydrogenase-like protein